MDLIMMNLKSLIVINLLVINLKIKTVFDNDNNKGLIVNGIIYYYAFISVNLEYIDSNILVQNKKIKTPWYS